MPSTLIRFLLAACMAAATANAAHAAETAAEYPTRPIHIIVPFTSGSGSDSSARFYGEALGRELGQPVIVDNRPGANGIIGLQMFKRQPADGYTILLASNSPMSVNPIVLKNLPYDPVADFKPVSGLGRGMNVFLVPVSSPLKTISDVVSYTKRTGKTLSVATYSAGYQLAATWFANMAGIKFTDVLYKGQAQIMTDLMGNQIDMAVVDLGGALSLVKDGKVRALAVSGEQRHRDFPNVPTIRESGYPDYVQYSWVSFYVGAKTPDGITQKLSEAMQKVLLTPEARSFQATNGGEIMPYTPKEMSALQQTEIARFRKVAAQSGIKPQ